MRWKDIPLQTRLYLISALVLLAGGGSAMLVYLTAHDDSNAAAGYEIVDGNVYPIEPENSKAYIHDMELFGGKAAVLADEFRRWFEGLWHGKSLALTIALGTVIISAGFFYLAGRLPSATPDEKDRA